MRKFELDNKIDWYNHRVKVWRRVFCDRSIDVDTVTRYQGMKNSVIYESPKTFTDGVAYNDGTWVVFSTFRTKKGGKLVGNIRVKDLNEMIRLLYSYMVFLKLTGIENRNILVYFTLTFFDRITFQKGLFDCTQKNENRLFKLADRVLYKNNEELTKDWTRDVKEKIGCWDERKFCLDTEGMSKSAISKKRNQILDKKNKTDEMIKIYYDPSKSIRKNLEILQNNGVKVGKSRLGNWVKENTVQNRPLVDEDEVSKTDHCTVQSRPSIEDEVLEILRLVNEGEQGVQNRPLEGVQNRPLDCPKQTITFINNKRNGIEPISSIQSQPNKEKKTRRISLSFNESDYTEEEREMIRQHLIYEKNKEDKILDENNTIDLF